MWWWIRIFFWLILKIVGLFVVAAALVGVALSAGIVIYGNQAIDIGAAQTVTALDIVNVNLDTTTDVLRLAQNTIGDVNVTVDTVELTALNLSKTVADTDPLLEQIGSIATEEVPNSIDAVQQTLPNIAEVAGTIDNTLATLSQFGFNQSFFGLGELNFDLGIEYDPEVRFDQSILTLSTGLSGIPEDLRSLDTQIQVTRDNLGNVSTDIAELSSNLDAVNSSLAETPVLLEQYIITITDLQDQLRTLKGQILGQTETAKIYLLYFAIWVGVMQIGPIFMGLWMIFASRPRRKTSDIIIRELIREKVERERADARAAEAAAS